jgi:hypothetical protein
LAKTRNTFEKLQREIVKRRKAEEKRRRKHLKKENAVPSERPADESPIDSKYERIHPFGTSHVA